MARRGAKRAIGALLALCFSSGMAQAGSACQEPANGAIPDIALTEFASGFTHPVYLTHAGDGSGRLYVVEQEGRIRMVERATGKVLPEPFLDLRDEVESGGEKGLLSVAFHPDYRHNGRFFIDYTRATPELYTIISGLERGADGRARNGSERPLLEIAQPFPNHNGGQLAFGPDGYLYIGMGDGGLANDPFGHGQDRGTLLGALLRIDVDHARDDAPYALPADNPFVQDPRARPEIYAYGLRNPWRFSFDPATGELYLADVGQGRIEEIDVIRAGGNYGWDLMEGDLCNASNAAACRDPDLIAPIATYDHSQGISVTGGFVYRGQAVPGLCGTYLYGDYGSGRIWGLRYRDGKVTARRELLKTSLNISSFGSDEQGEIYVLDHGSGKILRIAPARN